MLPLLKREPNTRAHLGSWHLRKREFHAGTEPKAIHPAWADRREIITRRNPEPPFNNLLDNGQEPASNHACDIELIKHSDAVVCSSLGSLSVPMYSLKKSKTFLIFGVRAFGLQYKATRGIGEGAQPGRTWTRTSRDAGAFANQSGRTTIPTPSMANCLETTGSPVVT